MRLSLLEQISRVEFKMCRSKNTRLTGLSPPKFPPNLPSPSKNCALEETDFEIAQRTENLLISVPLGVAREQLN